MDKKNEERVKNFIATGLPVTDEEVTGINLPWWATTGIILLFAVIVIIAVFGLRH